VWLVQRKGVQTPMAKAFVELLRRKAAVRSALGLR